VDVTELDRESAELVPDRQALGCWNYGWHGCGCGYSEVGLSLNVNISVTSQVVNCGW
jgi:hypothetical protein